MSEYFLEKSKAIIISFFPYRSSSLILECFSDREGRISFLCKGFYSSKSFSNLPIERGVILDVVFIKKSDVENGRLFVLSEAEAFLIPAFKNYKVFLAFEHFWEFLSNIQTTEAGEHASFYKLYLTFLNLVEKMEDVKKIFFFMYLCELIGLNILGFFPSVKFCFSCRKRLENAFFFRKKDRAFFCRKCSNDEGDFFIDNLLSSLLFLIYDRKISPASLLEFSSKKADFSGMLKSVKAIFLSCAEGVFEGDIKSEYFIEDFLNKGKEH